MDNDQYVSVKRAQELAGVSRRTIYNWKDAGKLDYIRTAGGAMRIKVDSLFRPGDVRKDA